MQNKTVWIGIAAFILLSSCALQEDVYTLDHRLTALERRNLEVEKQNQDLANRNRELATAKEKISSQVEDLNQNRRDDEMALRSQYASLVADVQALQDASKSHAGQLEEISYQLDQKLKRFEEVQGKNQERMDRLATDMADIQKRLDIIEQYLKLDGSQARTPVPTPAPVQPAAKPAPVTKKMPDEERYLLAKKAFDSGDMTTARKEFETLIAENPKSQHADNAQFWIGETYFREKWYEKAILEYQKVIENYPNGNKVAAALLKQGIAFQKIGETSNARLVLKELIAKYPGSSEAEAAKKKLESL